MLRYANVFEIRRTDVGRRREDAFGHALPEGGRRQEHERCWQKAFTAESAEGAQRALRIASRAALDRVDGGGCPYINARHRILILLAHFFFVLPFCCWDDCS